MEQYIQISKINDFLFCPLSLYLHSVYENFHDKVYHQSPQVIGKIKHEPVDTKGKKKRARSGRYIYGMSVFSNKYNILGKLDTYDSLTKSLIERKTYIKKIYPGHLMQLYAQYFCMKEMGYEVRHLYIQSLANNKRYEFSIPDQMAVKKFEELLIKINSFNPHNLQNHSCPKCKNSIYGELSW